MRSEGRAKPGISRTQFALAGCIILLGIYTAVYTCLLIHRSFSPAIDWDQWEIVRQLMQSGGHLTASQLWEQQNEHRIPFGRLACAVDLLWFGGRSISLLIENYLTQVLAVLLFCFALMRFGHLSRPGLLSAIGFATFCFFSPFQVDNFIRGFQLTFLLCLVAAMGAFAAAIMHARQTHMREGERFVSGALIVAILCALVAEFSLSSGLLAWPTLILLSYGLRLRRRTQVLLLSVAMVSIALYFVDFALPPSQTNLGGTLHHPGRLLAYVCVYFGSTWKSMTLVSSWPPLWTFELPRFIWPTVTDSCTFGALAIAIIGAGRFVVRRAKTEYLSAFLLANMMFTVAVASLTGLGRLNDGIRQAASTRYQSVALIFWVSFAAFVIKQIDGRDRSTRLIELQIAAMILIMAAAGRFAMYEHIAMDRKAALGRAYLALLRDPSDANAYRDLYVAPGMLPAWSQYLQSKGWGPRASDFPEFSSILWSVKTPRSYTNVNGFHVVPSSACAGVLDRATAVADRPEEASIAGWAWDVGRKTPPRRILIVLSTGRVIGDTTAHLPRPDVPQSRRDVSSADTGWATTVRVPEHASLQAFALLSDTDSVCPLTGEFRR